MNGLIRITAVVLLLVLASGCTAEQWRNALRGAGQGMQNWAAEQQEQQQQPPPDVGNIVIAHGVGGDG